MRSVFRRTTEPVPQTLDLYDVAYLSGAPQRMMEVALVALHERGVVRIRVSRVRLVEEPVDRRVHPVERAIIALCRRHSRSTLSLLEAIEGGPEVGEIERRMIASRLMTPRRCRLTRAGRQHLEAAEQSGEYPAYVFEGLGALPDVALRYHIGEVIETPLSLGGRLIRLGEALDDRQSGHRHDGGGLLR
ncbi:TIGR04222 domain-containing membrane protein [Streptomyces sp. NPDC059850]|uniref:TIGR04222 domain-containing membrane protein n=1 Tax=Streptomyces sp. NPDC059850 TaxID=3346970 RepID=UPI003651CE3D